MFPLPARPEVFDGIELGSVGGEILYVQQRFLGFHIRSDLLRFMDTEVVDDENQFSPDMVLDEFQE